MQNGQRKQKKRIGDINMKSLYNLTSSHASDFDIGDIIPILCQEAVPTGEYKIAPRLNISFSPMNGPVFGQFKLKIRTFFVKLKDIWDNFPEHFATNDQVTYPNPFRTVDLNTIYTNDDHKLLRYIGLTASTDAYAKDLNWLPVRAYQKIYYEHYQKQFGNSIETPEYITTNGVDNTTPDIVARDFYELDECNSPANRMEHSQTLGTIPTIDATVNPFTLQDVQNLIAKTKQASLAQKFAYRAQDFIDNLFGVDADRNRQAKLIYSKDEFFTFQNVTNVAASANYPLGIQQSLGSANSNGDIYFEASEFGYIMTLVSVVPYLPNYGGNKYDMFAPDDGYRYFNENFANVGYEPVKNRELCRNAAAFNEQVAGYVPIYDRYRHGRNILGNTYQTTFAALTVHRSLTDPGNRKIDPNEFDYLFTAYSLPQIRCFAVSNIIARLPVPKIVDANTAATSRTI